MAKGIHPAGFIHDRRLRTFRNSFEVDADIDRVWRFYIDIGHLEVITPKELKLRVLRSTQQVLTQGSEVWLEGRLITKSRWHSAITVLRPYEYVDEMLEGKFKVWKHAHKFRRLDHGATEVIDEITFELPYGLLGRLFEGYILRRLVQIFEHRKRATIAALRQN